MDVSVEEASISLGVSPMKTDLLIMFPFVIPGAVLGISLIVAFNKQPVILTGTAMIMIDRRSADQNGFIY